jgi:DNA-binding response OmpR family regulator
MSRKPHILLIDDSEATVEGLRSYLNPRFEVATAADGFGAMSALESRSFDLMITDLILPDMSGLSLISFLRQKSPRTPIIAITGWRQPSNGIPAVTGADVLLMKPFELGELDRSLDNLMIHRVR